MCVLHAYVSVCQTSMAGHGMDGVRCAQFPEKSVLKIREPKSQIAGNITMPNRSI